MQRLNTPAKVQRFFSSLPYNWERDGGTMRSFREVVKRNEAHCLEAAVAAAVILEQHGYPPLLLDLESVDLLDHVLFVFKENGGWGSVARSRDIGLHGRKPVYRSLRDLAWSYFDPYVDFSGRLKGYGLTSLYEFGNYDWRFSSRKMTKIEDHLAPSLTNRCAPRMRVTRNCLPAITFTRNVILDRLQVITTAVGIGCCNRGFHGSD